MKHRKITGVLVNVNTGTVKEVTIEANLDSYYKTLDCTCIDIVVRKLGPYRFDIICDDEGLLKANPRVSATGPNGQPMLVGNLFFCHHDEEGNTTSLHPDEVTFILSRVSYLLDVVSLNSWPFIQRLSY